MKSSDNAICPCYIVGFQLSLEWGTGKTFFLAKNMIGRSFGQSM